MLITPQAREVAIISERDCLVLILTVASLVDIIWYKVPNRLIVSALPVSLIWRIQTSGMTGVVLWIAGILVPVVICFLLYVCRVIGASDIKIFSMIGSFVEIRILIAIMVMSLFFGAIMAVGKMFLEKNFSRRFRHFFNYVNQVVNGKKIQPYYDVALHGTSGVIPYTVAITLATMYFLYP